MFVLLLSFLTHSIHRHLFGIHCFYVVFEAMRCHRKPARIIVIVARIVFYYLFLRPGCDKEAPLFLSIMQPVIIALLSSRIITSALGDLSF